MGLYDELYGKQGARGNTDQAQAQRVSGVTSGIVVENWDDKHPGMVKVELFLGEKGKNQTDWIRVAMPYAGSNYGVYALPEVGDEVLVAFNMGNLNRPYVIGSLYSTKQKPPEGSAVEKNTIKRIKTKGGHELIFDEEEGKETIQLKTPKGLLLTLADEQEIITITDQSGENLLTVDSKNGAIAVTAKKTITLSAGGKASLELDGTANSAELKAGNIKLTADQGLTQKAQNFTAEGNMMSLKGKGSFQIESSAMLQLKGAMTKIN